MRVTASKVGLLEHCQYFATPAAEWVNTTSAAADRGTRFHRAIDRYTRSGAVEEVDEDIRAEYEQARAWVDSVRAAYPEAQFCTEQAFAWSPETDEAEIIAAAERDYAAGHGRLCGTADLVVVFPDAVMVYDWKTGSGEGAGPQLRALGLMAARAYGVDAASVAALEVTAVGVREVAAEHLESFDLSGVAGALADLIAFIPGAEPRPGSHCGELYCPARATCPAGQTALAELVPADALVKAAPFRLSTTIESAEHAVWSLDVLRLVDSAAKAIKEAIKAATPADGWELADGSKLVETTRDMPRFDKNKALLLLKQLGATDEQIAACTYTWKESAGLKVVGGPASAKPKRTRKPKAA